MFNDTSFSLEEPTVRLTELYKNYTIAPLTIYDLNQDPLPNCWLTAMLAFLVVFKAGDPPVFKCEGNSHCFKVQLWLDGKITNITLDDKVPARKTKTWLHPRYTRVYNDNIKPALYSKALAKILQGYARFRGSSYAWPAALLGKGRLIDPLQSSIASWSEITTPLLLGSKTLPPNQLSGLSPHHAYALISANNKTKRVVLFNGNIGNHHAESTFPEASVFYFWPGSELIKNLAFKGGHFFDMPFAEFQRLIEVTRIRLDNVKFSGKSRVFNKLKTPVTCLFSTARNGVYLPPFPELKICVKVKEETTCAIGSDWNTVLKLVVPGRTYGEIKDPPQDTFSWIQCYSDIF